MASSTAIIKPTINSNPTQNLSITSILSITEMSYQPHIPNHTISIPSSLLHMSNSSNTNISSDTKLTLIAALRNSLINKDTDSFLFCLEQTDNVLIESTIKGLDESTIKMFIEKLIDLFQRSTVYKLSLISWMRMILKCHYFTIMSMDNNVIGNLTKIKDLICNYTKNHKKLVVIDRKLNIIEKIDRDGKVDKRGNNDNKGNVEALLVYEESDDEEVVKRKEKKLKALEENGIKEYDVNNEEDEDDDDNKMNIEAEADDEDYFDMDDDDDKNEESGNPFTLKKHKSQEEDEESNGESD